MKSNEQFIRDLAHQIWESEGKPEGQSERHWLLAHKAAQANGYTNRHKSTDPSEATGSTEPEQPDQT